MDNKIKGQHADVVIYDNVPLAQTFINGKLAPWTPYGVELDPRKFARSKDQLCPKCEYNKRFCICKKEGE